ncbi:hypothetical protein [Vibrio maerlii]|uniref:hypothetical protein n=1 Tax=Vibrio maerlii TaxID=2231648 RepID=UPI000E3D2DC3|nr:hypothetical protein [Vibrio maerlii]
MMVQRKHNDVHKPYDPQLDFTSDQRHRYTQVANEAVERRRNRPEPKEVFKAVKEKALTPLGRASKLRAEQKQRDKVRYAAWTITLLAFWLWVMYMTS